MNANNCHALLLSALMIYSTAASSVIDSSRTIVQDRQNQIILKWGVKIPMQDGVNLNATLYRPRDTETPLPVVFFLTPYSPDYWHSKAAYFARHGFIFALVDIRGRGNSEGTFEPWLNESRDGYDLVEWFAKQPWCSGKVSMWGGSYCGFSQWATVKGIPPHLASIVPVASVHPRIDFPGARNIDTPFTMQWLTDVSGLAEQSALYDDTAFWIEQYYKFYMLHLPFRQLDQFIGNPSQIFQKWVDHPMQDSFWDAMNPNPDEYKRINIPILTITGNYDDDQAGALAFYRQHMQFGLPEAKQQHYLIIGPWDHPGTRTPKEELCGLKFGPNSLLDMNELHRQWYNWTLKGGTKPEFLKKRVAYYVAGAEEWKYADSLEEISKPWVLYLTSNGTANDVFHSGTLSKSMPKNSPPDHWTYDPLDLRPAELERDEIKNSATDQRYALNLFDNGVVYHTEVFSEDVEISGQPKLTLALAMDVLDTDIMARLYEIRSDGSSIMLGALWYPGMTSYPAVLRARHRKSPSQENLVMPGVIETYTIDNFNWFSRRIAKGSRLRLVINCPNTIFLQKNYNSGRPVADESAKDAHTAHITLYHDKEHPSVLELPIARQ